jgi:hypothetical protein
METCDRHNSALALWRAENALTMHTLTLCGHCKMAHETKLLAEGFYFTAISEFAAVHAY